MTPKGRVTWSLRIRVSGEGGQSARGRKVKGNQYRLTLGTYPAISIKAARARASEYLAQAETGRHPARELERQAVARTDTVARLVETFLTDYARPHLRSWANARSSLMGHMVPVWGNRPVHTIEGREAAQLLAEVARGKIDPKTKQRVPRIGAAAELRKWGSSLFAWAISNGWARSNPFEKTRSPGKAKPRQRFLTMDEAWAVWQATDELPYPWRDLFMLLLLTACRMREMAHARWSWVTLAERRLVIPPERYKTEKPFLVALPSAAVAILEGLPRWNEGDYLFTATGGVGPVWSIPRKVTNRLHARAEKLLGRSIPHFVVHDLRRTVRTHLARLQVPEVVAELVLGHALRGVAGTYNVYDFETEKHHALERWSTELTAGGGIDVQRKGPLQCRP